MIKQSIIFVSVVLFISCGNPPSADAPVTDGPEVAVYEVKTEEIKQVIEGFGNLSFRRKADVTSAVDGIIKELSVEEGDSVNTEQILASLYNIQLVIRKKQAEADLLSAQSALDLSENQYREGRLNTESRIIAIEKSELNLKQKKLELEHQRRLLTNKKELLAIGGISNDEIKTMELTFSALETEVKLLEKDMEMQRIGFRDKDISLFGYRVPDDDSKKRKLLIDINSLSLKSEQRVAEARVKSAETEMESAQELLNETILTSPFEGIVGARYMEAGERMKSDSKLFTIFDSSKVDLVFTVPEKIGVLLSPGQEVKLKIDAVENREFSARIRQISPTIDTRSGNISIKAELNNDEGLFRPGMFSRFILTYGSFRTVIRIPAETLVQKDGGRGLVFKVSGERAYPVNITIKQEGGGMVETDNGLEDGDIIIINPSPLLQEGDIIHVQ